jgi:hypothetical protein
MMATDLVVWGENATVLMIADLAMCRTLCLQYGAKFFTSHYCVGYQSRAAVMDAATIAKPLLSKIPDLTFQL